MTRQARGWLGSVGVEGARGTDREERVRESGRWGGNERRVHVSKGSAGVRGRRERVVVGGCRLKGREWGGES